MYRAQPACRARQPRRIRALAIDRQNATDIDKTPKPHPHPRPTQYDRYRQNAKAALSPSSDIMRQISTKRQSRAPTLVRHNATNIDKHSKAALSTSTDTMRQITTKTPKPHSPPRPTQYDRYRQNIRSHSLPLDRHNTTVIDKNAIAVLFPSTDIMRQISTKTPKPSSPPRPTQYDSYRQNVKAALSPSSDTMRQISTKRQSRALPLDRHNATNIDKNAKASHPLDRHNATDNNSA